MLTPSQRSLLLLFAVFAVPLALAYGVYYLWPPSGHVNYGELISPRPVPDAALRDLDGRAFSLARLRGKWLLVQWDSGACAESCRQKLYLMRQARLAQGKDKDRVERVWLLEDGRQPAPQVVSDNAGTWIVDAGGSGLQQYFPAPGAPRDHVYLVDPLGNVMLRFPADPDGRRMVKDLARLLRVSRAG
ncbi:MAG TPA: cytochrome C oxidase subunit I [Burkholderiales bacterium]